MQNKYKLLIKVPTKASIEILTNYFLIVYAFLLPVSTHYSKTIFIFILIGFLFTSNFQKKVIDVLRNRLVQAFLLFYLIHFLWFFGSDNLLIAKFKILDFRYILYIIIFATVIKEQYKEKILNGFIFGILFSEIVSYLMFFNILPDYITVKAYSTNVPFMQSYTQYAVILSLSLGLMIYKIINGNTSIITKTLYSFFFLSASTNIFIIDSKLGYGLYSISILTVILFIFRKKISKKIIFFTFLLIGTTYILAYSNSSIVKSKVYSIKHGLVNAYEKQEYQGSVGLRIGWWIYSYDVFKNNILFGVGTGDHLDEVKKIVDLDTKNKAALSVALTSGGNGSLHSEYLDNLIQFGLIGLFVFLNIFYSIYKTSSTNSTIELLKYLLLIIFLTNSTVSLIFIHSTLGKIFILLSALLVSQQKKNSCSSYN